MRLRSLLPSAALALTACFSGTAPDKTDPYAGMECDQKVAAIARDIQAWQASQPAAATVSADSADTAKTDTAGKAVIPVFRGYPPVAGLDPVDSGIIIPDRPDSVKPGSSTGVQWIPPVGFDPVIPKPGPETTSPTVLPGSISTLQIVSSGAYKARVRIQDYRDELVREFTQEFGAQGELANPNRMVPGGLVSFLVWDGKDASGRAAPSGVYLWKVRLEMDSRQVIEKTAKTGFIGEECRPAR